MSIITPPPTGGPQIVRHALARRWRSIIVGTFLGALIGVLVAFVVPPSHAATVVLTIAAPAATPTPIARTSLSATDMVTEKGIIRSTATLGPVLESQGAGLDLEALEDMISIEGDTDGTIVSITVTANSFARSASLADAIAQSYLTERTRLAETRADEMAEQLQSRADQFAQEKAILEQSGQGQSPRVQQLSGLLDELSKQIAGLSAYHTTAGRVITPAATSIDTRVPTRRQVVLIGLFVGLFAGFVLVLVRERTSKVLVSPIHLADLTGLPVWTRQETRAGGNWRATAQAIDLSLGDVDAFDIVGSSKDAETRSLLDALRAAQVRNHRRAARLIDSAAGLDSVLRESARSEHLVVVVRKEAPLPLLRDLLTPLTAAGRRIHALVYLPAGTSAQNRNSVPAGPPAVQSSDDDDSSGPREPSSRKTSKWDGRAKQQPLAVK